MPTQILTTLEYLGTFPDSATTTAHHFGIAVQVAASGATVTASMDSLYKPWTWQNPGITIWPVKPDARNVPEYRGKDLAPRDGEIVDIVGPICESGDFLARNRPLPRTQRGDLLAVFTAGAYGFAMSSNYNNRPRAAEVLVEGDSYRIIRRRENYQDLVAAERG